MKTTKKQLFNKKTTRLFYSIILKKLISYLMKGGKKAKTEKILKNVFVKISLRKLSPVNILTLAIINIKPFVEVRNVRVKGKSYKVPFTLQTARQLTSSFKTMLKSAKTSRNFEDSLVEELINSSLGRSQSVRITRDLHKTAFQNRSFISYRWF
jgi:ribosomal protein S7